MTTTDNADNLERTLGKLEGRVEEQGALLHQLHADMNAGFQQVNSRIDKLALAIIAVGGGMMAAMLGIVAALVVLIVQNG